MRDLELLQTHPLLAAYSTVLIIGGIVAMITAIVRYPKQSRLGFPGVHPWALRTPDFILFGCLFLVWYIFASSIAATLAERLTPDGEEPSVFLIAAANLCLHGGLMVLFWRWRDLHRTTDERNLNTHQLSFWQALGTGAFCLFAAYPLVLGIAIGWEALLNVGKQAGLSINLAPQQAIELFQETTDPLAYISLALIAVVVAPIAEELIFRAGFYRWFLGKFGRLSATILSGLIFGFVHGHLLGFVPLAALGMLFCIAYEVSGNLKVPIIMHALFNLNTLILLLLTRDVVAG